METLIHSNTITPVDTEIQLVLSTSKLKTVLENNNTLKCDWNFPISPPLQFSNKAWSLGLKAIMLPSKILNIPDGVCSLTIRENNNVYVISLDGQMAFSAVDICAFLNAQIAVKSSFTTNIAFHSTNTRLISCLLTPPGPGMHFGIAFNWQLCSLLGYKINTAFFAPSSGASFTKRGSMNADPYACVKLIQVESKSVSALATRQKDEKNGSSYNQIALLQITSNYSMDEANPPTLSETRPTSLVTINIPSEDIVYYPISQQTLFNLNLKISPENQGEPLAVDAAYPVIFKVILRRDNPFV
jgi:hypothetical protein